MLGFVACECVDRKEFMKEGTKIGTQRDQALREFKAVSSYWSRAFSGWVCSCLILGHIIGRARYLLNVPCLLDNVEC